jgi:hypothetical protein
MLGAGRHQGEQIAMKSTLWFRLYVDLHDNKKGGE